MTIDVVTPMVDDPEAFGAIAAANALSDVYAMGGAPKVALGFVGFPTSELDLDVLRAILDGLSNVCREAGCPIVGGHTIVDPEPKAGLSVTGTVSAANAWTHGRALPGQALVLTKAIGTGVIVQASRTEEAPREVVEVAVAQMRTLNARARDLGVAASATSATDVTGFGLLGHLRHMMDASGAQAILHAASVPFLPGATDLAAAGFIPGGSRKNLRYVEAVTRFGQGIDETTKLLLADAQTSGGLLLTVPSANAQKLVDALLGTGARAAKIGEITSRAEADRAIDVV
jgi:selenide, water dikinase